MLYKQLIKLFGDNPGKWFKTTEIAELLDSDVPTVKRRLHLLHDRALIKARGCNTEWSVTA